MIVAVGTDIVRISRLQAALARRGERFARRILSQDEFSGFLRRPDGVQAAYLAKRFAAKEAVGKALGTGLGGLSWHDIGVCSDSRGAPSVRLEGRALERFIAKGATHIHLSLSDEPDFALAFVVIETIGPAAGLD